ncbi:MAG: peptidoglycan-binding protein [Angelakisella sp.]|nr:peptidoglycan-binding protein [Angelakisella sp.]
MPNGNATGGFGGLQVNVYINGLGRPAENALVRVSNPSNSVVLEEARTDSLGQIPEIELPSPPIDYSMEPSSRPFNQYNVSVTLPGYTQANIFNVQIYPGSTSIQETLLTPAYSNIQIPYPVLWGDFPPKIPEDEVKKLPLPGDFIVLPKPVVPEIIVVHAGAPNDTSAKNYTVGFKDYIKNVASSEIYPTWPRETLKANILAILSFTMSRVYTEWYRSKGYNFTVTNSTSYDQAFTYGRDIFKEISNIVDEIFTTYISRPDIIQPLFTQYSDGIKIKREGWLSQWGSKYLGDDGYTALQILKDYYGSDIILKQAEKVSGIPLSFPGYVLEIGSTGAPVKTIQEQLNAISKNYPLIPKLVVDGIYGQKTADSVRVFQQVFKLPVNGIVDFRTWYKLSEIFTSVKKLA